MNVYARFDEIPSMTLKLIKKTKRNGRTDGRTDNMKTVYEGVSKSSCTNAITF